MKLKEGSGGVRFVVGRSEFQFWVCYFELLRNLSGGVDIQVQTVGYRGWKLGEMPEQEM